MSSGHWRIILAVLGLISISALLAAGYYQLESSEQQPYAQEKYQPARDARLPVPVKEGEIVSEPYQPNCQAPKSKDDADLCAQWSAVQATTEANRLNRIGLRVTYFEFSALIVSLIFTGWAAIAAAQQVRLSRLSLTITERPFVFQDAHKVTEIFDTSTNKPIGWRVAVLWKNGGNTPAHRTITHLNSTKRMATLPVDFTFEDFDDLVLAPAFLGPGATTQSGEVIFSLDDVKNVKEGIVNCYFWGWYEYSDEFEGSARHRSEFAFKMNVVGDPFPTGVFFSPEPLQKHNGFDDYCMHKARTTGFEAAPTLISSKFVVAHGLNAKVANVRLRPVDGGWKLIFDTILQNFRNSAVTIFVAPVGWAFGGLPPNSPQFPTVTSERQIIVSPKQQWLNESIDLNKELISDELAKRLLSNEWPLYIFGLYHIIDDEGRPGTVGYCYLARFLGPDLSEVSPVLNDAYWERT